MASANDAPLMLETAGEVDRSGNARTYLVLRDGRKLPLPHTPRVAEFTLAGNCETYATGKLIALYDESTRTGAIYVARLGAPYWVTWQPCMRDAFFLELVPETLASRPWAS